MTGTIGMTGTTGTMTTSGPGALPEHPTARLGRSGRRGTRVPARAQIMGWVLLVLVVVLLAIVLIVRQFLHEDVTEQTVGALEQEAGEFVAFAATGQDPATGRPITAPDALLRTHLSRQYPDSGEALVGAWRSPAGVRSISQEQDGAIGQVATDPELLHRILDDPAPQGTIDTPRGQMHWLKVRADTGSGPAWFVAQRYTADEVAAANHTVQLLAGVSAFGLLLAAVSSWVVAGLILEPVRTIRHTAAEISEHDLTRRIPVHGRDDIAALADQFNAMLGRLEDAFRIQRQFVDDAGHELRTPITIVRGNLELLGDDPAEREEVVRLCTDELDRMTRIVEDLLVLAKADRPDFVTPDEVSLVELTSDIDAKVRSLGDRQWVLEQVGEGDVFADEQRITQAVVQLAQNAVQHTEPGSTIRIGSAVRGCTASLWVSDNGPGLQPDEAERIFERFAHGNARSGGAGLGLAIVRAIADGHQGQVRVVSEPGAGAAFVLELPARAAEPQAEEVPV